MKLTEDEHFSSKTCFARCFSTYTASITQQGNMNDYTCMQYNGMWQKYKEKGFLP